MAALPPAHRQPNDDHDQSDLQDQPEDRGQSAQTPEHPAPKQHAEQAGAEETSGEAAEQAAAAVEKAAPSRCRSRRSGAARLRECSVERLRGTRRSGRARRGRKCSRSPRTRAGAAADPRVGRRDCEQQWHRQR